MYNADIQLTELYRYQEKVNVAKLRAEKRLRGIYGKAMQGTSYSAKSFLQHMEEAFEADKDYGALHFLDYQNYTVGKEVQWGRDQFDAFWEVAEGKTNLPFVLDTETNEGASWAQFNSKTASRILSIALAWHIRAKEVTGHFGGDYISGWATDFMHNFTEGFLWCPRYKTLRATRRMIVNYKTIEAGDYYQPEINHFLLAEELQDYIQPKYYQYKKCSIWQYGSLLTGFADAPIDTNVFNGTEEDYQTWKNWGVKVPVIEVPEPKPLIVKITDWIKGQTNKSLDRKNLVK